MKASLKALPIHEEIGGEAFAIIRNDRGDATGAGFGAHRDIAHIHAEGAADVFQPVDEAVVLDVIGMVRVQERQAARAAAKDLALLHERRNFSAEVGFVVGVVAVAAREIGQLRPILRGEGAAAE